MIHDLAVLMESIPEIYNLLDLIIIAIIYTIVSLMSCCGLIFLIFFKYVRETYELAKATRESLQKEEIELIKISDKISRCSASFEPDRLRLLYISEQAIKITVSQDNNQN